MSFSIPTTTFLVFLDLKRSRKTHQDMVPKMESHFQAKIQEYKFCSCKIDDTSKALYCNTTYARTSELLRPHGIVATLTIQPVLSKHSNAKLRYN